MRYKKPCVDKLLTAIEAEISIGRQPGNLAGHLRYMHRLVHELEEALYRAPPKASKKEDVSEIEYIFRKLEYE